MKYLAFVSVVLVVIMMGLAAVASAQYHDEQLDNWLNGHTRVRAELERNPDLIYDRKWRDQHPGLREFMQSHPNVWEKIGKRNPAATHENPEFTPEHPDSAVGREQPTELSKHSEREQAKEAKHEQQEQAKEAKHEQYEQAKEAKHREHEEAKAEAKAERHHK